MTNEYELKGDTLVNEANELSSDSSSDKTIKLLDKASINYTLAKAHSKAGGVFSSLGDLYSSINDTYLSASNYNKAGEAYIKAEDYTNAKIYLDKVYELYLSNGNYVSAGKTTVTIAEILAKQDLIVEAIDYYTKAYDYYLMENNEITGASHLRKAGYLLISCDEYYKAINRLRTVFDHYSSKELTASSNRELLLDIGIIYIYLRDFNGCHEWLDFCAANNLQNSISFICLRDLVSSIENKDMSTFSSLINSPILTKTFNIHINKCLDGIKLFSL